MRAVICPEFGPPEVLRVAEMPTPEIAPGTARVRIAYAAINYADIVMIEGSYQKKRPLPFISGMEYSGVVTECGPGVTRVKPGDRVMSFEFFDCFADEIVVPAEHLYPVPDGKKLTEAAALIVGYGTGLGALEWRARMQPGEWVLVHGAAGGVGLGTVEVAKAMGGKVIACAGGAEKVARAIAQGADYGIDYIGEDIRERVLEITGGRGVDVVVDPVGGDAWEASLRCVHWRARMVIVGFAGGRIPQIPANILLVKNVAAVGYWWGDYREKRPAMMDDSVARLTAWWEAGKINPHVSAILPMEEVTEAMNLLIRREATGRVLLNIGGEET
ncbi:MAG: NADPH:quinone oxidoreductase family protein [Alphaproteobacteria bacterium]